MKPPSSSKTGPEVAGYHLRRSAHWRETSSRSEDGVLPGVHGFECLCLSKWLQSMDTENTEDAEDAYLRRESDSFREQQNRTGEKATLSVTAVSSEKAHEQDSAEQRVLGRGLVTLDTPEVCVE